MYKENAENRGFFRTTATPRNIKDACDIIKKITYLSRHESKRIKSTEEPHEDGHQQHET
jgi:hypothetical protein